MNIKAIILDFDGVVVESNHIKHQAFSEMFKEYTEYYDQIMQYHMAHNHVSRHDKFKYIVEEILHQTYTRQHANQLAHRFVELTRGKIIKCPFVDGAFEFIRYFSVKYPLYVASATPLDELKIILKARDLMQYFKTIYGAPMKKIDMFYNVIENERVVPDELLFIGDSFEDYTVAKQSGVSFLARISSYSFKETDVKSFHNLSEIKSYLLKGGM